MNYYDPKERAKEKQAARDQDALDIKEGRATPQEVNRRNSMFGGLKITFKIKSIGNRELKYLPTK